MFKLELIDYIVFGLGFLSLMLWFVFFLGGLKHNKMFEVLDEKEYPLKEIYGLGFFVLELIKYDYKRKGDRKLRQQLNILYEEKYTEYYIRVVRAQQISISLTLFAVSFTMYGFSSDILTVLIVLMFSGLAFYYYGALAKNRINKRSRELLDDFSEAVSKLALLTNTGMILRESWKEVAYQGKGLIYEEMRNSLVEMENGVSDVEAIHEFGIRCVVPEIRKFTSTIVQSMSKGNSELSLMLQEQSKEVWNLKKQILRREGEKASSRLLIPISIMFIGILIMIIVPIFANLGNM